MPVKNKEAVKPDVILEVPEPFEAPEPIEENAIPEIPDIVESAHDEYNLTGAMQPDENSDDPKGYGSQVSTPKSTEYEKQLQEKQIIEHSKRLKADVQEAKEAVENAKTPQEKAEAEKQLEEATTRLDESFFSPFKLIRTKVDKDGNKELVMVPYCAYKKDPNTRKEIYDSKLQPGTTYRGGEVENTYAINKIMEELCKKHPELKAPYITSIMKGDDMAATKVLCEWYEKGHNGVVGEINPRLFADINTLQTEAKKMQKAMTDIFVAFQQEHYALLKQKNMTDDEAMRIAFEHMAGNMESVVDTNAKFSAMLNGNDTEKILAQGILADIWTEAAAEYRVRVDEEIKKLSPEQLKKIGEGKLLKAAQEIESGKKYVGRIIMDDNALVGLTLMAGFFPPMFFVALLPAIIDFSAAAYNKAHASFAPKLQEKEYYKKINERISVMSAVNVTDALVKSYIDLNLAGKGTEFAKAVNGMVRPKSVEGGMEKDALVNVAQDLAAKLKNANFEKYFEKELESNKDKDFMKLVVDAFRDANGIKETLINKANDIANLATRTDREDVAELKKRCQASGVDIKDSPSEAILKMLKKDNWYIDAYAPFSLDELQGCAINNGNHYDYNKIRGIRGGVNNNVLVDYYTAQSNLDANSNAKEKRSLSALDMKSRLMVSFEKYRDEYAGKVGMGYIKSAFISDYLCHAANMIVDSKIEKKVKKKGTLSETERSELQQQRDTIVKTVKKNDVWTQLAKEAGYSPDSEITKLMQQFSIAAAMAESFTAQVDNLSKTIGKENSFGESQIEYFKQESIEETTALRDKIQELDTHAFDRFAKAADKIERRSEQIKTDIMHRHLDNDGNMRPAAHYWESLSMCDKEDAEDNKEVQKSKDHQNEPNNGTDRDKQKQHRKELGNIMGKAVAMSDGEDHTDPYDREAKANKLPPIPLDDAAKLVSVSANKDASAILKRYIETANDLRFDPDAKRTARGAMFSAIENGAKMKEGTTPGTDPALLALLMGANESRNIMETQTLAGHEVGYDFGHKMDQRTLAKLGAFDPSR